MSIIRHGPGPEKPMRPDPIWLWIATLAVVIPFIPPAVWVCAKLDLMMQHMLTRLL